jgi:hypothetical protein
VRRITSAAIAATLFSFTFVPTAVLADCAADIETIEEALKSDGGSKAAAGDVRAARKLVEKAKAALAEGNEKKCENLVKKAQDRLGNS